MLHAFLHKQSHTPTHSPYYQVALMNGCSPRQLLFMCECVTEERCKMVMANAGVKNMVWGISKFQLCVCVCVLQKCLWAKSWCIRTSGAFRCVHWRRSVRKPTASHSTTTIKLWYSECMCTHGWTHTHTHTHHLLIGMLRVKSRGFWAPTWCSQLDCEIKIANWKC